MADNSGLQDSPLVSVLSKFDRVFETPETYLKPPSTLYKDTLRGVKSLFDYSKRDERRATRRLEDTCPLQELFVDGFDDEQIWQEIELQNSPLLGCLTKDIHDLKKQTLTLTLFPTTGSTTNFKSLSGQDQASTFYSECNGEERSDRSSQADLELERESESESNEHVFGDGSCVDDNSDDDVDNKTVNSSGEGLKRSNKKSEVDDRFFKLSDMLQFLDKEDRRFGRAHTKWHKEENADDNDDDDDDDNEPIDYFIDLESETEEEEWTRAVGVVANIVGRKGVSMRQKRKSISAGRMKYSDFFDPPDGEHTRNKENESDSEEDQDVTEEREDSGIEQGDNDYTISDKDEETSFVHDVQLEIQSSFEKKQLKLSQKIEKLEKANLAQKPWQMSGETGGSIRPINSLLEDDVDFDHMTTTAPVITEETTQSLEDLIRQRIKDEAWDDVERKVKPDAEPFEYKKKQPLDHEKSKLSLSQIYEQEYLKQTQAETEEKENEEHTEIKALMSKLFAKLDALSNFHFTPKPPKPELKIVSNVPVLSMEEVAPVSVSDAMMLAPEEVHEKKTELKGETEQTDTDRKRKRRAKKRRQHERAQGTEKRRKLAEKLKPSLGKKLTKQKAFEKLEKEMRSSKTVSVLTDEGGEKNLKSSSAFFSRLQDEVQDQIRTKKDAKKKKDKSTIAKVSQLKL